MPDTLSSTGCPSDADLAAFVDGSTTLERTAAIEAHVDGCSTCHQVLAVFGQESALRSITGVEATGAASGAAAEVVGRLQSLRPLLPGTKLGRFVLLEWVGEGAAGVLYAAYDPELDRKVALKLMHPRPGAEGKSTPPRDDDGARERVIEEARAMGKAAHPNVVTVHDVGTFEGRVFIAMEFVEGTTLGSWLRAGKRTVEQILAVYTEAGRGLAAAHAAGLVHRDFKPSNVLRGEDGRVRVTDFGLAQPATPADGADGHGERFVSGTPAYMAPEQLTGGRVDARSDQFGFCVALYEALYGESPFTVPLKEALLTGAKTAIREPPASTRVSSWTRRCVLRGLEPDPDKRHPGMRELLDALGHDPSVMRRRYLALASAALVVLVVLGAGALGWRHAVVARREVCEHAQDRLGAIWNDPQQVALASTFAAVGTPYASAVWPRVRATINRFSAAWIDDRGRTCRAVLAHAEPAAVDNDEHIVCLDDRLRELHALIDELATVKTTEDAYGGLSAAASLPSLSLCDSGQHRAAPAGVKLDPTRAELVRTALARADVLDHAMRSDEAEEAAALAVKTATEMGDPELLGHSLFKRGELADDLGRHVDAERDLHAALVAAEKVGDDNLRGNVFAALISVAGDESHDLAAAWQWHDEALAVLQRVGTDDHLEALVRVNMSWVLRSQGKIDEALVEARAAVAAGERLDDPLNLCATLVDLASIEAARADFAAAASTFRRSVAVAEQALGADHPVVLGSQNNLASMLLEQRDLGAALGIAQHLVLVGGSSAQSERIFLVTDAEVLVEMGRGDEALALLLRPEMALDPAGSPQAPTELLALIGRAFLGANRPAEAVAPLEQAVAASAEADARYLSEARFALARTLTALHRDPARAHQLAVDAAHGFDELPYPSPLILARKEELRAWLETNKLSPPSSRANR